MINVREVPLNQIEGKKYNILKININYRKSNYKVSFYKDRFIRRDEELADIDMTVIYKVDKDVLKNIRNFELYLSSDVICYEHGGLVYDCWFNGSSDIAFKDNNIITVVYKCKGHVYLPEVNKFIDCDGNDYEYFGRIAPGTRVDIFISTYAIGSEEKVNDFCLYIYGESSNRKLNTISFKWSDVKGEWGIEILSSISQIKGIDIDKIHIDDFIVSPYEGLIFRWDKDIMAKYRIEFRYRERV